MATFSAILIPAGNGVTSTLAATTASGSITLSPYTKIAINATEDVTIVFYSSKGAAVVPSATVGMRLPANATMTFDMGSSLDTFAIFNSSATTATYSYQRLSVIS